MIPLNHSLKYGLITGMVFIAYTVLLYVANMNLFSPSFAVINGLVTFGLMIFMLIFTMRKTRDLELGGKINFKQAFLVGFVMILIASYMNSFFSFALNEYIDPEYMARQVENFEATMDGKFPAEQLETMVDSILDNANATKGLIRSLWVKPITSAFLSAVIALFVKKSSEQQGAF